MLADFQVPKHQTAECTHPSPHSDMSLSHQLWTSPDISHQPCIITVTLRTDTGQNLHLLVEHVGPVQPGEHSHSNPREVSLQLPLLWQGSERQACSAAKTKTAVSKRRTWCHTAPTPSPPHNQVPHFGHQLKYVPQKIKASMQCNPAVSKGERKSSSH